ncbi:MAG: xanthine dehydrogenase family protein subunit M [Litorilinea sp.]
MQAFDYVRATSVDEVVSLLAENGDQARVLSGGTDLLVALREGRRRAKLVIDVKALPETTEMVYSPDSGLRLGAAVPCHRMYDDKAVAQAYPGLMDAATLIGGTQIQGRASMGGNLCNASPAADSIPTLIAHGAVAVIAGPNGKRELPVEEFCTGPGRHAMQDSEFLLYLNIPAPVDGFGGAYRRFIPRNEMDIAVVGCGASVVLDEGRSKIVSARVSLGAVAPTPLFVQAAGDALAGKAANADAVEEAARIAQDAAKPISDMRGTAEYRKHIAGVLTRRVLTQAIDRAKAA